MPFVQAKCPECGGMLAVDDSKKAAVCQFCGDAFIVQEAINNYNTYNITNNTTNQNFGEGAVVNIFENRNSISALVKRAYMFLEDGDFERVQEYVEKILDIEPENSEAYFINWLRSLKKRDIKELLLSVDGQILDSRVFDDVNFLKCIKFSNEEFKETLVDVRKIIETNFDNEIKKQEGTLISLCGVPQNKLYNFMWKGDVNQPLTDETKERELEKSMKLREKYLIEKFRVIVVEKADFSWFKENLLVFENIMMNNMSFVLCVNSCEDELLKTLLVNCMRNNIHGILIVLEENDTTFKILNEIGRKFKDSETEVFEKVFVDKDNVFFKINEKYGEYLSIK